VTPTVFREGPFRAFFFSLEESRMHVHIETADGEAKLWLEPEISLAKSHGLADHEVNRALKLVREHEQEIRDAWHKHFGG
jgi:hypothetical protein